MPKLSEDSLAEVQEDILRGARECFVTYGYDGATVTLLEHATGKSRGAIFHHFQNKEALFLAVAHRDMDRMATAAARHGMVGMMRAILDAPDRENWWGMRAEILRRVRHDPCFRAKWELDQLALRTAVTERLRDHAARGILRTDVDPETLFDVLDLILEGAMAKLSTSPDSPNPPAVDGLRRALDVVEKGLRT